MGSFQGHILPGSFFILFGIWWAHSAWSLYFKTLRRRKASGREISFRFNSTYQSACCPNIPIEGYCKLAASLIGMTGEAVTAFEDGYFKYIGNSQHITMFLFFGINGLVDIMMFYKYPIPEGMDYMSMTLAVVVEALLFIFHLHGRDALDIHVHTLLIIAIVASIFSVLVEWKYRHNVLSTLFKTGCLLLQGTWFYQIGFTLYSPFSPVEKLDEHNSHRKIMLITAVFCWHIAGVMTFMFFVGYYHYIKHRPYIDNILTMTEIPYPSVQYSNFENEHLTDNGDHVFLDKNKKSENRNGKLSNNNIANNIHDNRNPKYSLSNIEESADDEEL